MASFLEQLALAEIPVLDWIQAHLGCGFLDAFLAPLTRLSDAGMIWIAIAVVLLLFKKTRRTGAGMAFALLTGLIICNGILKPIIARTRPYDFVLERFGREITLLIPRETDFSFPSGHTIAAFEGSIVLMLNDKRMGIPALILAVLTAFSRLYLFVHYPSDVLVSVVLGTAFAFAGNAAAKALFKRFPTLEGKKAAC